MQKTDTLDDPRLSPQQLLAYISTELQRALPDHDIAPARDEPGKLRLIDRSNGREAVRLDLANLMAELFAAPFDAGRIDTRVSDFVAMARNALSVPVLDADAVFPVLRHSAFLDAYGEDGLTRPGPGDCGLILMQDMGASLTTVDAARAEAAGWRPDALWEKAERNFGRAASSVQICEGGPGVFSLWIDGLEWASNSLLIATDVLRQAMAETGMDAAFVVAPSRESVELVDSRDDKALHKLAFWMRECLDGPHPQSEFVFRLDALTGPPVPRYVFDHGKLRALN